MKLFAKEEYEPCSGRLPLTSIEQNFNDNTVKINFHEKLLPKYLMTDQHFIECCYQEVTRSGENTTADDKFSWVFLQLIESFPLFTFLFSSLSKCNYFEGSFELPMSIEFVLIQCKAMYSETSRKNSRTVYSNAHAVIRKSHETKKTIDTFKTLYPADHPLSVLMIGIDSISRSNLIRAMPNTAQYLYDTGWFELKGYNKVSLVLNVS